MSKRTPPTHPRLQRSMIQAQLVERVGVSLPTLTAECWLQMDYSVYGSYLGFTLQDGDLTNVDGGNVDRQVVSLNGGRSSADIDWQSKLEYRRDRGAEERGGSPPTA